MKIRTGIPSYFIMTGVPEGPGSAGKFNRRGVLVRCIVNVALRVLQSSGFGKVRILLIPVSM